MNYSLGLKKFWGNKMNDTNPFAQDSTVRSKVESEGVGQPIRLRSRIKNVDEKVIERVDKVAVQTGWATDDEVKNTGAVVEPKMTEQLGVRVALPYLDFVKRMCSEKRQTKRVIVEEALDEYCKKYGFPPIS